MSQAQPAESHVGAELPKQHFALGIGEHLHPLAQRHCPTVYTASHSCGQKVVQFRCRQKAGCRNLDYEVEAKTRPILLGKCDLPDPLGPEPCQAHPKPNTFGPAHCLQQNVVFMDFLLMVLELSPQLSQIFLREPS